MGVASSNSHRKSSPVTTYHRKLANSSGVTAASARTSGVRPKSHLVSHTSWELSGWPLTLRRMPQSTFQRWRWLLISACVSTSLLVIVFYWRMNVFELGGDDYPNYSRDVIRQESDDHLQTSEGDFDMADNSENVVHVNPHKYRYLINPKNACFLMSPKKDDNRHLKVETAPSSFAVDEPPEQSVHLLIYVCSAINHSERREAIRQTWGSRNHLQKFRVVLVFLLGDVAGHKPPTADDKKNEEKIREESATYGDIVREDFVDSYYNLSLKAVMGLKWADRYCPTTAYVMKTDDDVFINLETLLQLLPAQPEVRRRRWIGGCIKQRKSPAPLDRYGQPLEMPLVGHPPFVAGAGYVISGDIVGELYRQTLATPIVPVEDAYVTAYCARSLGVHVQHYEGFNCGEPVARDCDMKTKFVGHHVKPERQHRIWKLLAENANSC